ncbi:Pyruvate formate-lyase [Salmonella enterica subsp. enterica serovar Urbana str. R8-2977]|uniref:Pyruvate formate-lyase n=1 Tax=Salmonella enterica subsp. enterica serovar Urbana str. R8-2977 TaxID=913084 RepID=G5RZ49_SALET|nr:Pyruvate formate-lyase [Salmonella enterica subsp. enterica serovar Urbana str. R8-2977]
MITGIQITKAANDDLLNSFWLLDSEKGEARCIVAKSGFAEDEVVAVSKLGEIEYREIPMEVKPEVRVEGGQHLNVNVTFCVVKLWTTLTFCVVKLWKTRLSIRKNTRS